MDKIKNNEVQFDASEIVMLIIKRWKVFMIIGFFSAAVGFSFSSLIPPYYRSSTVLITSQDSSGGLGAIANMSLGAGVDPSILGLGGSDETNLAIALLRSTTMTIAFIKQEGIEDELKKKWKEDNSYFWKSDEDPDLMDASEIFQSVLRYDNDMLSGTFTLSITWHDPVVAARWVNHLTAFLNHFMRARAEKLSILKAKKLISLLQTEQVSNVQSIISSQIQSEYAKISNISAQEDYAFTIVDEARPAKKKSGPKRLIFAIAFSISGSLMYLVYILIKGYYKPSQAKVEDTGKLKV